MQFSPWCLVRPCSCWRPWSPPHTLPQSFVCCGNRHRCSSCLTQGHFPLIATLYANGLHLPQQLSAFSSLSLQFSSSQPPFLILFLCFLFFHHSSNHSKKAFPDAPKILDTTSWPHNCLTIKLWRLRMARQEQGGCRVWKEAGAISFFFVIWEWFKKGDGWTSLHSNCREFGT